MAKAKKKRQPDLARALNAVRRMVRGLRSAAEAVERELKISGAQLFVLKELADVPDQSVKDLAAVTMTTHSTVSQVVSQLIAKGLVARTSHPADRRSAGDWRTASRSGSMLREWREFNRGCSSTSHSSTSVERARVPSRTPIKARDKEGGATTKMRKGRLEASLSHSNRLSPN